MTSAPLHLFVEPGDVWLFRDGKPFDSGSDHRATSLFPPPPSVVQGAIRSAYIAHQGVPFGNYINQQDPAAHALKAEIGWGSGDYGQMRLRGPFVARREGDALTRYYPLPADLVWRQAADGGSWERLQPTARRIPGLVSDMRAPVAAEEPLTWMFGSGIDTKPGRIRWIAEPALLAYLSGQGVPVVTDLCTDDALFCVEPHVSLEVNTRLRAAQESLIYEVAFVRPRPGVGFTLSVTGLDTARWGRAGILTLGGEQRLGHYTVAPTAAAPEAPGMLQGRFCLYLATPTYFDGGWQPAGGDWTACFSGSSTPQLVAALVERPLVLGGIDLAESSRRGRNAGVVHKPARRLVPAGSIYYFEVAGTVELRQPGSLCSAASDGQIGFGQVLAGKW